ncbi:Ras-related GTP-binding protein C [Acropora cervicornis]|uniref:Ras-related GTP-binding protein C n=1 Tax=Acropora cervicornis TaxID=6130 RepID=A0AAD9Q879_ACRCE|nr:Ras-related GTP-binding protein C [Acropora cervicornis]
MLLNECMQSFLCVVFSTISYGPEDQDELASSDNKPRILLLGLRRSGKSSIQKVVFHKMSPNETLFLESTNKIVKDGILFMLQLHQFN